MSEQLECPQCGNMNDATEIECPSCRCDLTVHQGAAESAESMDDIFAVAAESPDIEAAMPGTEDASDDMATADEDAASPPSDSNSISAPEAPSLDSGEAGSTEPTPEQGAMPQVANTGASQTDTTPAVAQVSTQADGSALVLQVEGFDQVIYRGKPTLQIDVTTQELAIGRRDPGKGIYPDIDLREFHGKPNAFVSRNHAQIIKVGEDYLIEDLAGLETTHFAESSDSELQVLPKNDRRKLAPGSRFMIGEVVVFRVADDSEE